MKPKAQNENDTGLVDYLEDIIGSNKYIQQIEQAQEQMNQANDQKIMHTNRFKVARNDLESMEDEKNAALEYIKKERTYFKVQNMCHFVQMGDVVIHLNDCLSKIEKKKEEISQIKDRKAAVMTENQQTVQDINECLARKEIAQNKEK